MAVRYEIELLIDFEKPSGEQMYCGPLLGPLPYF